LDCFMLPFLNILLHRRACANDLDSSTRCSPGWICRSPIQPRNDIYHRPHPDMAARICTSAADGQTPAPRIAKSPMGYVKPYPYPAWLHSGILIASYKFPALHLLFCDILPMLMLLYYCMHLTRIAAIFIVTPCLLRYATLLYGYHDLS
jgi:hypothetical protein